MQHLATGAKADRLGFVDFEALVATVGKERYESACAWVWRTAAGGAKGDVRPESWPDDLDGLPHDLADLWCDASTSRSEALDLALRLYEEMPCYGNTMHLFFFYSEFTAEERMTLWEAYRRFLSSADGRLANPVAYSLEVDFFEDETAVEEAWHELTRRDVTPWERRLQRVLAAAGSVPWRLKEQAFEQLCEGQAWHPWIVKALWGSAKAAFGEEVIDVRAARTWLDGLDIPEVPERAELRRRLDRITLDPTGPPSQVRDR